MELASISRTTVQYSAFFALGKFRYGVKGAFSKAQRPLSQPKALNPTGMFDYDSFFEKDNPKSCSWHSKHCKASTEEETKHYKVQEATKYDVLITSNKIHAVIDNRFSTHNKY